MKLYATLSSEKASRTVKKGGNELLYIELMTGNMHTASLYFDGKKLTVRTDWLTVETIEQTKT